MEVGLCLSVQSIICNIPANVTIKWCQSIITMRYVEQGSVDQRADKAIQKISVSKTYCPFNQTEIYPVHSVILSLNNKVHIFLCIHICVFSDSTINCCLFHHLKCPLQVHKFSVLQIFFWETHCKKLNMCSLQGSVVLWANNAIQWINRYPVEKGKQNV